jgi:hypothetical protein
MKKIKCNKANITLKNIEVITSFKKISLDLDYFLEWANFLLGYIEINQLYKKKSVLGVEILSKILILQIKAFQMSNDFRYLNVVFKFEQYKCKQSQIQSCIKLAYSEMERVLNSSRIVL